MGGRNQGSGIRDQGTGVFDEPGHTGIGQQSRDKKETLLLGSTGVRLDRTEGGGVGRAPHGGAHASGGPGNRQRCGSASGSSGGTGASTAGERYLVCALGRADGKDGVNVGPSGLCWFPCLPPRGTKNFSEYPAARENNGSGICRVKEPMNSGVKVLIVEDEPHALMGLAELISGWGYRTETAHDGIEGWEKAMAWNPAIVVTDLKMPRLDGIGLLAKFAAEGSLAAKTSVILLTAQGTIQTAVDAMKLGAYDYVLKPIDSARLRNILA